MKIREIMTTDVTTAELNTTLEEIATIMRHEDVGAVPILDDGELAGIVTDRDIVVRCVAEGRDPGECSAEDVLSEGLVTISPDDDVNEAAAIMSRNQVRRLPVLQDGKLVGVVSLGDIAVKEGNDEVSGDALEDISEGVKSASRRAPARKQRTAEDQQGISNHAADEEKQRQQRVVPIQAETPEKGSKQSRRKTG
jgi:CBS domain-containing protein